MTGFLDSSLIEDNNSYQLQRSLRFRASATAFLNRTPASATNRRTFTWSGWVKRGTLVQQRLLNAYSGDENNTTEFGFDPTNNIVVSNVISGTQGNGFYGQTSGVFRDPSAWYHIVFSIDTTQATAAAALRIFVNGVQQTLGASSYGGGINQNTWINTINVHRLGQTAPPNNAFFDGYLADVNFIDGQALTPSAFGQFDINGNWQAKPYTGTYGTNGFELDFSNPTSTTTLMLDRSGNNNNWTANNISLTPGASYDSMLDVPLGSGGSERGNYATLNPLDYFGGATATQANQFLSHASGAASAMRGSQVVTTKCYFETNLQNNAGVGWSVGVSTGACSSASFNTNGVFYAFSGQKRVGGVDSAYGASFTVNQFIGVAVDPAAGTIEFFKEGISQGVITSSLISAAGIRPTIWNNSSGGTATAFINFGQRPFVYAPPTGFSAFHTGNLPAPTIPNPKQHFDVVTRAGTSASATVTGLGFQPDFLWNKVRNVADDNQLVDSSRGVSKFLFSNLTLAEVTDATALTSFDSNGYTLGSSSRMNNTGRTYVDWLWKAGGTAVTNNAGSISAQVSANAAAGFSIVTYTGTGANATVGHGLGVAPKMVIVKNRDTSVSWMCWHTAFTGLEFINLNSTGAKSSSAALWNSTLPTSSVFSIGTEGGVSGNTQKLVAYCFAEIPGYSRIGSYTGNGSADGPFVFCGFRPRWLMVKNASIGSEGWRIWDSARQDYNVQGPIVEANSSAAEASGPMLDFTATGFKIRNTSSPYNGNGNTIIFIAFAESPFKYALAR